MDPQKRFENWLADDGTFITSVTRSVCKEGAVPSMTLHLRSDSGDGFDVRILLNRDAKHRNSNCKCGCELFCARIEGCLPRIKGVVSSETETGGKRQAFYLSCYEGETRHEFSVRATANDAILAFEYVPVGGELVKKPVGKLSSEPHKPPTHSYVKGVGLVNRSRRNKLLREIAQKSASPTYAKPRLVVVK